MKRIRHNSPAPIAKSVPRRDDRVLDGRGIMLRKLMVFLIAGVLSVSVVAAQQTPPEKAPRLKIRLEVSKKLAGLFILKDGKVLLKNGVELTLLRGCDVEVMAVDRNLNRGVQPDPKAPADLVRMHVQQDGEHPGLLANFPSFPRPDGKKMGLHMPSIGFFYGGLGGGVHYEAHMNCVDPPTAADWEKVRLLGLSQLDERMRKYLGESLLLPARLVYHEKPGWYVENPYLFVISGKADVGRGKERKQVPFRLPPGAPRLWSDAERFMVHDLVLSAPEKPKAEKSKVHR